MERKNLHIIEISNKTIFTVVALFVLYLLFPYLKDILVVLFVAFIIMSSIYPVVDIFNQLKMPKLISIFLSYILVVLAIALVFTVVITSFISQSHQLANEIPSIPNKLASTYPVLKPLIGKNTSSNIFNGFSSFTKTYFNQTSSNLSKIYSTSVNVFKVFSLIIATFIISIYMLIDKEKNTNLVLNLVKNKNKVKAKGIIDNIEKNLGAWLRGQLLLSAIVSIIYFISLSIIGLKFALPLSILAGFFELIPLIGAIFTAILIILISLAFNPGLFIPVIILCFLIQEFEAHVLVPNIMNRVMGINPIITIVSLILGAEMLGLVGALLAVPFAAVIQILLKVHYDRS